MAYDRKHFAAAARLWFEALASDPNLSVDRQAQHRYNTACAASLAAAGQGRDDPPPDDAAKAKLRGQALEWLKSELVTWTKILDVGPAQMTAAIAPVIQHSKADADLTGIRDTDALANLPDAERKQCVALWEQVDALLRKATDAPGRDGPSVSPK